MAVGAGMYDLCDDHDARRAGLDGGDLERDRASIGLNCGAIDADSPRYRYVAEDGDDTIVTVGERPSLEAPYRRGLSR